MSSTPYFTDLEPDAVSRNIVLAAGAGALLCGALAIAMVPAAVPWKTLGLLAWIGVGSRDLWLIASGYKRCARIRLHHEGSIQAFSSDGRCAAATLCAGSVVTSGFAWLRVELAGGRRCGLLLRRKAAKNKAWRRLQVIWRQLGAGG